MNLPNPTGSNQFYQPEPKYGDVKKMQQLTREAPMSGATLSGPAVAAPQRTQARAVQGRRSASNAQRASRGTPTPPDYSTELGMTWAEIAATPGASQLVQEIARRAIEYGA